MTEITETVDHHSELLRTQAKDFLERYDRLLAKVLDEHEMFLMGSLAFGYATAESDMDICVYVESPEDTSHLMQNLRRLNFRDTTPEYNSRVLEFHSTDSAYGRVHIMLEASEEKFANRLDQHARLREALKENQAVSNTVPLVDFIEKFKTEASWSGAGKYIYRALVKLLLAEQPV
jgi:predicted nucleotidyltransferase